MSKRSLNQHNTPCQGCNHRIDMSTCRRVMHTSCVNVKSVRTCDSLALPLRNGHLGSWITVSPEK